MSCHESKRNSGIRGKEIRIEPLMGELLDDFATCGGGRAQIQAVYQ